MTILYEYRPSLHRASRIRLKTEEDLVDYTGFRSAFGYPSRTAAVIQDTGRTKGLSTLPLYADKLYLDFDDEPQATNDAIIKLTELGFSFSVYATGGRGHHLVIDIEPLEGANVPASLKAWAEANIPKCDLSVYKPSQIIRLPGTRHVATGGIMELVSKIPGKKLKVERIVPIISLTPETNFGACQIDEDEDFINKVTNTMTTTITRPGANNHASKLAYMCYIGGMTRDETERVVYYWYHTHCHRLLEQHELPNILNQLYKRSV